jgi:hypothetical protein
VCAATRPPAPRSPGRPGRRAPHTARAHVQSFGAAMQQILVFSLTAMFNPTLLAATTVMLLLDRPKRLMLGYLCGALTMSITLGLIIVFELGSSGAVSTAKHTVNPAADIVLGCVLLVVAFVLGTGRHEGLAQRRRERKAAKPPKGPPRWQRELSKGSPRTTFAVGALLSLPGASYLAALTGIVKLDPGTTQSVLLVLMVNVIMLAFLEIPLICFAVAPEWTPRAIERGKAWIWRHGRRAAVIGAALLGAALVIRGVVTLL